MTFDSQLARQVSERLTTAAISDILDSMGLTRQAMAPELRPLDSGLVLFGQARTALLAEVQPGEEGREYALGIQLIDSLAAGDVVVLACGSSRRLCPWGDLVCSAAMGRGAAGCVTDGYVRDTVRIQADRFPVFHRGITPLDLAGRGKFQAIDIPVECGGVQVSPGDAILGDADGALVIPREQVPAVIEQGLEKARGEDRIREALKGGMALREAFEKFGTL